MKRGRFPGMLASALLACAVTGSCGSNPPIVARAAGHEWTVEQAASLIAPSRNLPASQDAVGALANLWVDYTLLATAVAKDSTLSSLDVSRVVQQLTGERLLSALRDSVVKPRPLSDAQLRALYERDGDASAVRARHILFVWPRAASAGQRDSLRSAMLNLRGDIVARRLDFATAARTRSNDTATARMGGEIGFVMHGQLIKPLEDAMFSLPAGAISQPVETGYGVHLIQVEERRKATFEQFRRIMATRQTLSAESTYVAGLERAANPQVTEGAADIVRELARDPHKSFGRRERIRALVRYRNGEVTAGEALEYLQQQPGNVRNQIALATDESIPNRIILSIARHELLLSEAARRGWAVRSDVQAQLDKAARRNLAAAALQLGLSNRRKTGRADVEQSVATLLSRIVSGEQREVIPLGAMSYVLRDQYQSQISEKGVQQAAKRIAEMRRTQSQGRAAE